MRWKPCSSQSQVETHIWAARPQSLALATMLHLPPSAHGPGPPDIVTLLCPHPHPPLATRPGSNSLDCPNSVASTCGSSGLIPSDPGSSHQRSQGHAAPLRHPRGLLWGLLWGGGGEEAQAMGGSTHLKICYRKCTWTNIHSPESSARLRKHPYCPAPPTERRRAFVQTLVQVSEVRPECG